MAIAFIFLAWQIAAKLVLGIVLLRRGVRHIGLLSFLFAGAAKSIYLAWCLSHGPRAYLQGWKSTQVWDYGLVIILTVDALYQISKHFPSARFTIVVASLFSVASFGAVFIACGWVSPPWHNAVADCYDALKMIHWWSAATIGGVWLWYNQGLTPWRPNTRRNVSGTLAAMGGDGLAYLLLRAGHGLGWMQVAGQLFLQGSTLAALLLWWRCDISGETEPPKPQQPHRVKRFSAAAGSIDAA